MAGHSKWANIKHRKGAQDAKRGKIFTKLIREITVAAKSNGDVSSNPRLRAAVQAARAQNLAKDTIDKAIKRGAGGQDTANWEEIRFEGYGPGGVAMIVEALTDNNNRTVGDVRHYFSKCGGNLGTNGCVAFMFDRKGVIVFEGANEDALMEAALELGAEDMISTDDLCEVITDPMEFETVLDGLAAKGFKNPISAEVTMRPQNTTTLTEEKQVSNLFKLIDLLEDHDDVQHVYANFDIPDEIMERLG